VKFIANREHHRFYDPFISSDFFYVGVERSLPTVQDLLRARASAQVINAGVS